MRRWMMCAGMPLLLAASVILADGPAAAQAPRTSGQVFSASERQIIDRNELLAAAVTRDPQLVRRALDAIAALDEMRAGAVAEDREGKREPAPKNPDLDRLERASPEAVNDLFQLLKQAGRTRPTKAK
ncbi:MAG: hypothetical protein C5B56_06715 [Proteobacteria bacterium]|nr:MAG: hypothetical protein C5B56_06715 [Pseudomonadota bacterium]